MQIIKTKSFQLAINTQGSNASKKIAICLPGRLDTKDYINFISHTNYFASRGYFAIAFDPPGTWESPDKIDFTTANYINATNELIEYFGNRPTLLFGHSRGGQTAMLVSCQNPSVTGFAVVNASFSSPTPPNPQKIKNGYLVEHRDIPPGDKRSDKQIEFHLSLNYFKDSKQYDCLPVLNKCSKPKLIMHGTRDQYYSPQEVNNIFVNICDPKMIHELNTEHDYRLYPEIIAEVNQVVGQFLDAYPVI